ncbi:MAG: hypothetical protein AB7S72_13275 [Draconibacterium sp.]
MKSKIFKLCPVVLLFLFVGVSCQKDEEIPYPKVEFDFKLLNENGEPSFTINEGENFTFHFKIITNDTIWKFYEFVDRDSNFFRVYRVEDGKQIDVGTPYKSYWCNTIESVCGQNNPFVFELPWITGIGENEIPDQSIFPPFCMFNETTLLPIGNYVTFFDEQIKFVRCGKLVDSKYEQFFYTTDLMHFKVEFTIK